MKRLFIFLFAALLTVLTFKLAHADGKAGTTALDYLEQGMGARAIGMGRAYSALSEGADSLFWNPAGLANSDSTEVLLNHQPLVEFMHLDVGSVAIPVGSSRIGAAYTQMKSDSIDRLDASGNSTGSFNVDDQLITAGYAKAMHGWSFGLSGKSIHSSLGDVSASAVAADAGINFSNPLSDKISHALVVQNVGGSLSYGDQSNSLPTVMRLGTAIRPTQKMNVGFDVIAPKGGALSAALGGELNIPLAKEMGLAMRAGYGTAQKDQGGMSGLGLGGGLSFSGLRLDFAWAPQNDFGSSEIFTLTYTFGAVKPASQPEPRIAAAPAPVAKQSLQVDVQSPASGLKNTTTSHTPTKKSVKQTLSE